MIHFRNDIYKYGFKLLYEITVVRVPVKVRKTRSLKLGPAAAPLGNSSPDDIMGEWRNISAFEDIMGSAKIFLH